MKKNKNTEQVEEQEVSTPQSDNMADEATATSDNVAVEPTLE